MKLFNILLIVTMTLLAVSAAAAANDFGWTRDFNLQAKAAPLEFRAKMAARFNLSDMQVIALRNIFASPADAYIMLRLGEIRGVLKSLSKEQGIEAINKYRSNRSKGWDVLAEILGIETESKEYLSLKRDHDLHDNNISDQVACRINDRGDDSM